MPNMPIERVPLFSRRRLSVVLILPMRADDGPAVDFRGRSIIRRSPKTS